MEKSSEAILSLRPVTFHYKTDTQDIPQFGLIAEEVVKVNPALVLPDKDGRPYTVRYDAVNAMLLNEFLKEHRTVNELKAMVA
jgi:trimeric autotransporter adhesin